MSQYDLYMQTDMQNKHRHGNAYSLKRIHKRTLPPFLTTCTNTHSHTLMHTNTHTCKHSHILFGPRISPKLTVQKNTIAIILSMFCPQSDQGYEPCSVLEEWRHVDAPAGAGLDDAGEPGTRTLTSGIGTTMASKGQALDPSKRSHGWALHPSWYAWMGPEPGGGRLGQEHGHLWCSSVTAPSPCVCYLLGVWWSCTALVAPHLATPVEKLTDWLNLEGNFGLYNSRCFMPDHNYEKVNWLIDREDNFSFVHLQLFHTWPHLRGFQVAPNLTIPVGRLITWLTG